LRNTKILIDIFFFDLSEDLIEYKDSYNAYFTDNFVLKPPLYRLYSAIKTEVFNISPIPHKVVFGIEKWMFLGDSYSNVILESKVSSVYSQKELDVFINGYIERNEWCNDNGIKCFIAIAPNKHTIYGEYLPITAIDKITKLDQIRDEFSKTDIDLIIMSDMLEEHRDEILFYKGGTHWNDTGAFWGYTRIINQINLYFPNITPLAISDFDEEIRYHRGDLRIMLDSEEEEETIALKYKYPEAIRVDNQLKIPKDYIFPPDLYEYRYTAPANNLKVLIFRDSFSSALEKYISENFGESVFIWDHTFDKKLILHEKPDIIIYEIIERNFVP